MEQEDAIGKWSIEKLELLRKYLHAYVQVLKNQHWCRGYEYIDGFAGTGKPKTRDEEKYVDGSPRVALGLSPPFTKYYFIETSSWRLKKLENLRREFPERNIEIYSQDCNKVLCNKVIPSLPRRSYKRAIAFLDPYGMQLEWETLQQLAQTQTIEIFLNVPLMAINRNVRRRRQKDIPVATKERMDRLWGTGNWLQEFYEEIPTLFGRQTVRKDQSTKQLGQRFRNRLQELFTHCTEPFLMTNSKNAPLYWLFFAGHNSTGYKIANNIFTKRR